MIKTTNQDEIFEDEHNKQVWNLQPTHRVLDSVEPHTDSRSLSLPGRIPHLDKATLRPHFVLLPTGTSSTCGSGCVSAQSSASPFPRSVWVSALGSSPPDPRGLWGGSSMEQAGDRTLPPSPALLKNL